MDEILKWVGASAALLWLPFIYNGFKRFFYPQEIILIPDKLVTIGFDLGSIIKLRLGMYTSSRSCNDDIVFDKINVRLKMPDKAEVLFCLHKVQEPVPAKFVDEKSQEVISFQPLPNVVNFLKVGCVLDRVVTFVDSSLEEKTRKELDDFCRRLQHLDQNNAPRSGMSDSLEVIELANKINASFVWREGEYGFEIEMVAIDKKIILKNCCRSFCISARDLAILEENKNKVSENIKRVLNEQPTERFKEIVVPLNIFEDSGRGGVGFFRRLGKYICFRL